MTRALVPIRDANSNAAAHVRQRDAMRTLRQVLVRLAFLDPDRAPDGLTSVYIPPHIRQLNKVQTKQRLYNVCQMIDAVGCKGRRDRNYQPTDDERRTYLDYRPLRWHSENLRVGAYSNPGKPWREWTDRNGFNRAVRQLLRPIAHGPDTGFLFSRDLLTTIRQNAAAMQGATGLISITDIGPLPYEVAHPILYRRDGNRRWVEDTHATARAAVKRY